MADAPVAGGSSRTVMTSSMVALFAASCGLAVANMYYAQPLLPQIARTFGVSKGPTAGVVTAAQVGYILGLSLVVPLGDILVRRRLVPIVLAAASLALAIGASAPSLIVLEVAIGAAGVCSVAAMILVPFASSLAPSERHGGVVGTVMSGLLLGILLARSFAGLVAQQSSWRTVYWLASAMMLLLAGILAVRLPGEQPRPGVHYLALLRSAARLLATEPVLQLRSALGALIFATFSVLWTGLSFLLADPPYGYGSATIGLFGLLGVVGAFAASFSGHLADQGWERRVTGGALLLLVASMAVMTLGGHHLWALMIGVVFADLAIQAVHIQNQHLVFALHPAARSRLNTGYMVCYFFGGAIGSATTGVAWTRGGWSGVMILGISFAATAFVVWAISVLVARPSVRQPHAGGLSADPTVDPSSA